MISAPPVRAGRGRPSHRLRTRIDYYADPATIAEVESATRDGDRTFDELAEAARRHARRERRVARAIHAGEIPPEAVGLAHRYAGWAFRQGWGDEHDLVSAAVDGVWRAADEASRLPAPLRDWRRWVGKYVGFRLRNVRRAHRRRTRHAFAAPVERFGVAGPDGEELDETLAEPVPFDAAADLDAPDFWEAATAGLTLTQLRAFLAYWRDGLTLTEAGERLGTDKRNVAAALDGAMPKVVRNVERFRGQVPYPQGRPGGFVPPRRLTAFYVDFETYQRCLDVFRRRLGRTPVGIKCDLRGVLSTLRYHWTIDARWDRLPPHLPPKDVARGWLQRWTAAGIADELRAILAPAGVLRAPHSRPAESAA